MSDRLPPLTALRAFEAAARLGSFQDAAKELHVTAAALSFQIKSLEDHLGAKLFHRLNRAVELTEIGHLLAPELTEGFTTLHNAWRKAKRMQSSNQLTITAGPGFTAKWLAPRMFRFAQDHPEIELRFAANLKIMDFERDDIDIAIRFSKTVDQNLHNEMLFQEWMTPMIPAHLAEHIKTPADLARNSISMFMVDESLNFLNDASYWEHWFKAQNMDITPNGPSFWQADHALDAVLEANAAIMGRASLTFNSLKTGVLKAPFDLAVKTSGAYYFMCRKEDLRRKDIQIFRDWLFEEIKELHELEKNKRFLEPPNS